MASRHNNCLHEHPRIVVWNNTKLRDSRDKFEISPPLPPFFYLYKIRYSKDAKLLTFDKMLLFLFYKIDIIRILYSVVTNRWSIRDWGAVMRATYQILEIAIKHLYGHRFVTMLTTQTNELKKICLILYSNILHSLFIIEYFFFRSK